MHATSRRISSFSADWMNGIDVNVILNIPIARSLLVSNLETEGPWELAMTVNDFVLPECLYQAFLDQDSSMTSFSILHKCHTRKRIFFTQAWYDHLAQKC